MYHVGSSFDISVPGAELRRIACLLAASPSVCEKEVSFLVLYFICPTSIEDMNYRLELECMYGAALVSSTFSGHLVAGIERLDGKVTLLVGGGSSSWNIVFGIFALWLLPNTPQQVRSFSPE